MSLEQKIVNEAERMGFAAAGIAAVGPSETYDIFKNWIASGHAANMDFLGRHCLPRSDPRNIAREAKSLIAVAARYPVNPRPGEGFSCYARGMDYHVVLRKKLEKLAEFINGKTRIQTARICVDSAPILEREWAARAGIGWRGKQGQIVNPRFGCCLLLGELLIDIELAPSLRIPDQCGTCGKCLDACPTNALSEDGLVSAGTCISYLTIEHKGEIPTTIHRQMGESLFGCDICTAVCPWNRFGNDRVMPELRERPMPSAEECRSMTEKEFEQRFNRTPVYRTGLQSLQRNAEIALHKYIST